MGRGLWKMDGGGTQRTRDSEWVTGRAMKGRGGGKYRFKARWRVGKVLMKKSKVWMKPRETHSVKESVVGSWRKTRYYLDRWESGRDRDGEEGFWAKRIFCGFCCEYWDEVICEEKKRIENRTEERKKSGGDDRRPRGRGKETINGRERNLAPAHQ